MLNIGAMIKLTLPVNKGPHNEEASFLSHQTHSSKKSIILSDDENSVQQTGEDPPNE